MGIHTAEPLVPEPSLVEVRIATGKLESYKSPGTDQILTKFIKAGGEILRIEIHKLIRSVWNKEKCHSSTRNLLLYQFIKRLIRLTNNYRITLLSAAT
jgi:hypothetical protein